MFHKCLVPGLQWTGSAWQYKSQYNKNSKLVAETHPALLFLFLRATPIVAARTNRSTRRISVYEVWWWLLCVCWTLDCDSRADGCRGSTSSISSVSSFNSSADTQPLHFHVGSTDDELAHLNRWKSSFTFTKVAILGLSSSLFSLCLPLTYV